MDPFEVTQWVVRILLAVAFTFMGVLHFVPKVQRAMASMVPPNLRFKKPLTPRALVIYSGITLIVGSLLLVIPGLHLAGAIVLVVTLIAVFPANAYASTQPERFGSFAVPVKARAVAQIFLIALCFFAGV
ncbi:DoxX family protein [Humidisolicoccus flavus]|uniref:DoxX family protein n=1 Tax=Humidisolicoccus flavus TaxID=3111414 RepID=UPI0032459765